MKTPENPIRIGEQEFKFEDLPPEAQTLVQHMISVDGKLNKLAFEVQQLQIARQAVYTQLLESVKPEQENENGDAQVKSQVGQ